MKKSFSPFNLVMSSRRGILTTTGQSHNKRLNTYASKRNVRELIPDKNKTKTTSTLVTLFFQPMSSGGQTKVTNACFEKLCLSDSSCSGDSVSESKPEASQVTTCQEY